MAESRSVLSISNLNIYYGNFHAVKNVSVDIHRQSVTAFIGPSGCGKSTVLRAVNRMNELIPKTRTEGKMHFICPAASSSVCVSRGQSRLIRISFLWMSLLQRLILYPLPKSKI